MATYRQIREYVKAKNGFSPKTCWIAHVKELVGLDPKQSANRHNVDERKYPCPPDKQNPIIDAMRHFGDL